MYRALLWMSCLLLVACGDDSMGSLDDGGGEKIDSMDRDGQVIVPDSFSGRETAAPADLGVERDAGLVDGPQPVDGPYLFDGPDLAEGGPLPDGPQIVDGAQQFDGSQVVDGPYTFDGPTGDGSDPRLDGSLLADGPNLDAPASDGAFDDAPAPDGWTGDDFASPDTLVYYQDLRLGDAALLGDGVATITDAGMYLCYNIDLSLSPCQCNDGVDNDGDNLVDYPYDPCCIAPWDHTEQGGNTQCTDCIDNDDDGLIDSADHDCTGPLDNDEANLGTSIPGDNTPCKQDCFFDGDSGTDCIWYLECDPLEPAKHLTKPPQSNCWPYNESMLGTDKCPWETPTCTVCHQSQECYDVCLPITPNGCDCFGCCAIPVHSDGGLTTRTILLRDTCKANPDGTIDPDQDADNNGKLDCPPCTQVPDCTNTCGLCEVCVGKPLPDPSCFPQPPGDGGMSTGDGAAPGDGAVAGDGGVESPCPSGLLYCGPGGIDPNQCPSGTYCISGCCVGGEGS